ncbi:hypothetical protein BCR34DRAFT_591021 [Clohesyomyces aquaticus]|uniref:Uncharacterized protein n=1 Tax=Clohesyomyces aquaticus TaxID=1231657 RepID=A0A1Y1Z467_9PLEO|nr:hypothetical protein BCR34DRAFT_591021 [Clohesyomyces aquaticus]
MQPNYRQQRSPCQFTSVSRPAEEKPPRPPISDSQSPHRAFESASASEPERAPGREPASELAPTAPHSTPNTTVPPKRFYTNLPLNPLIQHLMNPNHPSRLDILIFPLFLISLLWGLELRTWAQVFGFVGSVCGLLYAMWLLYTGLKLVLGSIWGWRRRSKKGSASEERHNCRCHHTRRVSVPVREGEVVVWSCGCFDWGSVVDEAVKERVRREVRKKGARCCG